MSIDSGVERQYPDVSIISALREEFSQVHTFWMAIIADPEIALRNIFPNMLKCFELDNQLFEGTEAALGPADICGYLENITSYLVDPTKFNLGVGNLAYNPLELFGVEGVVALVELGYELMTTS